MKYRTLLKLLCLFSLMISLGFWFIILPAEVGAQGPDPGGIGAQALVGSAFTYQGSLVKDGVAVNDSCNFQFGLWDETSGGSQVGVFQTVNGVTVSNGSFAVNLNGGNQFGSAPFTGSARYLSIAIQCSADAGFVLLSPRVALNPVPYALALPGLWTQPNGTSPNIIGGYSGNSIAPAGEGITISGGGSSAGPNAANGNYSVIGGGRKNTAGGLEATVGGGADNTASGAASTVSGGLSNSAAGSDSTVSGGIGNTASGDRTAVGGGNSNSAGGSDTVIGGGENNTTSADYAAIGGGQNNTANGIGSTIAGGVSNAITSTAALDFFAVAYSTIAGGSNNHVSNPYSTIGGGQNNPAGRVNGSGDTVGGGENNQALGSDSTIGGGRGNTITNMGGYSTIAGGTSITVTGAYAAVGGGEKNQATNSSATISGGNTNTAGGASSAIGGGVNNVADGFAATVPGGDSNVAQGFYSFAAGRLATAAHDGAFVWGDSTNAQVSSTSNNQFIVRASGGVTMYTSSGLGSGVTLHSGSGSWSTLSDRNAKENLALVDGRQVLARLAELPISTWNYRTQAPSTRHIGPMAQDFYAAFKLGESDTMISAVDADGVMMAALQGLYQLVQEQAAQIAALQEENTGLAARLATLEDQVGGRP